MPYTVPPADGSVRWAKWRLRFERDANGNIPQGSTPQIARMLDDPALVARIQASFDGIYAVETEVRTVLNADGISMIQYPYYLAFGREMWKLTNRVNGASAALEASTLIAKWAARGLSSSTLENIRYQVFSIVAPVSP